MPNQKRLPRFLLFFTLFLALCAGMISPHVEQGVEAKPLGANALDVIISEVAWGGTAANSSDEWMELYNRTSLPINLSGWTLVADDGNPNIALVGVIPANGYFLLESGDDTTISNFTADQIYSGDLQNNNTAEILRLRDNSSNQIDTANISGGTWDGGSGSPTFNTMERLSAPFSTDSNSQWISQTNSFGGLDAMGNALKGTPRNSKLDLSLLASVSSPPYIVGNNVVFTVTVTNSGLYTATNLTVLVNFPTAGINYQSNMVSSGAYTPGTGLWTIPSIPNGGNVTLNITATIAGEGVKTMVAEIVSADQFDIDSTAGNGISTEDDYSLVKASTSGAIPLTITNNVNNSTPLVGSNVIFTINVDNPLGNPYDATNVNVSALLPVGLTYISHSATQGTYTNGTGAWSVGTIPVNSNATLTITAKVINNTPATFTTTVSSNEYLDNIASSSLNNPLSGQAELTIDQTFGPNTGVTGQVELVLSLKNNGPDIATGVSVRDLLPSGLTYVSHTTAAGTYDSNTGIWSIGSVTNGATVELRIKVKVAASGASTNNTAQIWTTNQFDSNPADNSKSLDVPIADISLLQTVDLTPTTAIFTITVNNSGPDDATIKVKSNLPDLASYSHVSNSDPANFNELNGEWNVGVLPDGASKTLVITTNTTGTLQSHIVEIFSSNMVDPDSVPNNKQPLEDDISGLPYADLSLTQTVNNASPNQNASVVFTIKLTNSGPNAVGGVKVKSLLPAGLIFVSSSTVTGSYISNSGIWTVGTLAAGATAELKITAIVSASGSYLNLAEVFESGLYDPDSIPGNGLNTEDDNASVSISTVSVVRSVIINEVAWAGTGSASNLSDDEWIELYNPTGTAINLTGWTVKATDGSPSILISAGCAAVSIPAGGYYLLERDDDTTVNDITADCIYSGSLSNSGEILTLYDPSNRVIDTANGNGGGWPAGSSSTHGTMERIGTSAETDNTWATNTGVKRNGKDANGGNILGTPKQSNTFIPTPTPTPQKTITPTPTPVWIVPTVAIDPRPIINEILVRPGFDWNQDKAADVFDEFIEIKNLTAIDITLNGWRLDKVGGGSFNLPNVTLRPNERIVFYSKDTNLLLSDGGETVRLIGPNGKIYDAFTYTIARTEDRSYCRLPDGTPGNSWFEDCIPSPNLSNTREGKSPTSPDNAASPVCNLPDTIPLDFFIPECNGYGADIWNPFYWDIINWIEKLWIQQPAEKWRTFIE